MMLVVYTLVNFINWTEIIFSYMYKEISISFFFLNKIQGADLEKRLFAVMFCKKYTLKIVGENFCFYLLIVQTNQWAITITKIAWYSFPHDFGVEEENLHVWIVLLLKVN